MVYFVGRTTKTVDRVARELAEGGTACAAAPWAQLDPAKAHLCVLLSAPKTQADRATFAELVRRNVPLFSLAAHPAFAANGPYAVCRLPCDMETEALRSFLGWFARRPAALEPGVESAEKNRRLVHELRLASELQRSILPRGTPQGAAVNLALKYVPYQYIGGDFYDFVSLPDGRIGLVIADACGHGIAAAFLTAMFKSAFGLFAQDGGSPARTLSRLNTELARTLMADHFMSAFYAILDPSTGELTYCSAGHPPQLLFRSSGEATELSSLGFLLGSIEAARYVDGSLTMNPGDRLLMYTDGIVEATDSAGSRFGREHMVEVVRARFSSPIEEISNELLSEAVMFLDRPTFQDDVTFILAEVAEEL